MRDIVGWLTDRIGTQLEEIVIVLSPRSSPRSRAICEFLAGENGGSRASGPTTERDLIIEEPVRSMSASARHRLYCRWAAREPAGSRGGQNA